MSHQLISHSPDLKKLRDEGYELEIKEAHLLVRNIPYVNSKREVAFGMLVTPLGNVSGDRVAKPHDHTFYFAGDAPCNKDGIVISGILNSSQHKKLAEGIEVDQYFSAKPQSGNYENYYEKVITYINIITPHALIVNPSVRVKTFNPIETNEQDIVFKYLDTNSSRSEINMISDKLKNIKIAIIGLGGTGSYVLDFVSKTQVKEIHIFDNDTFYSHNAFRAPGAISLDGLMKRQKKVEYYHDVYSKIHRYIIPHDYYLTDSNIDTLLEMNFVFVCIDESEIKKSIFHKLTEVGIPFVDVGVGIHAIDGSLTGSIRVTTATKEKCDHINQRISYSDWEHDDYKTNIQIAEINALNAALAVIKWKKLFGFYHDLEKEHQTVYNIDCNQLINDENINT